ncbi:hypothetical protein V8E54_015076 [Elaphomyces granulatus]
MDSSSPIPISPSRSLSSSPPIPISPTWIGPQPSSPDLPSPYRPRGGIPNESEDSSPQLPSTERQPSDWEGDAQWQPRLPRPIVDIGFYYSDRRRPSVASVDENMTPMTREDVDGRDGDRNGDGNETGEPSGWRDPFQYATPPPRSARPRRRWRDEDRRHFEGFNAELIIREERHEAYLLEHLQRHHGRMPEPQGDFDVFAGIRAARPRR